MSKERREQLRAQLAALLAQRTAEKKIHRDACATATAIIDARYAPQIIQLHAEIGRANQRGPGPAPTEAQRNRLLRIAEMYDSGFRLSEIAEKIKVPGEPALSRERIRQLRNKGRKLMSSAKEPSCES